MLIIKIHVRRENFVFENFQSKVNNCSSFLFLLQVRDEGERI